MKPILWSVDRYGWWFENRKPSAAALAAAWKQGKATEVSVDVPGRRDVRA